MSSSLSKEFESPSISVFAGNANPLLAEGIARHLHAPLGRAYVGRFSDGEVNVEIMENVRGRDVFIVQPTCPPANDNLMELLMMTDACRRASAARITAVVPYFGYSRQDRRPRATRSAITAKLVANMIAGAGAAGGCVEAQLQRPGGGVAGYRRCGPRARVRAPPG